MEDLGKNEDFLIEISKDQAHAIITEYYKRYENFHGKIIFSLYCKGLPDGWGFTDYYGRLDLKFIDKIKILDQEVEKTTYIRYEDLDFPKIFRPFFDNDEYELTNKWALDMDVDEDKYPPYTTFNGIKLWAKRKEKEKILKK